MNDIHIADSKGQQTKYDVPTARRLWNEGGIGRDSSYWIQGMPEWRPAVEFFEVAQAPAAEAVPPTITVERQRGFVKDPVRLTKFLVGLLWTYLGFAVISALVNAVALLTGHVANTDPDSSSFTAYDWINLVVGLPQFAVVVTTAVIFLMWIHRANRNARGLGAEGMTFTPGWSVGWYFVPFANLWKPCQAMKEIWQASMDPAAWRSQTPPSLVSTWWALWVFSNLLSNVSLRLSVGANTSSQLVVSETVSLVSELLDIPLCLVAIRLVRELIRLQSRWAAHPSALTCPICRQPMTPEESIFLNQSWVCVRCKPVMLQRIQEGVGGV